MNEKPCRCATMNLPSLPSDCLPKEMFSECVVEEMPTIAELVGTYQRSLMHDHGVDAHGHALPGGLPCEVAEYLAFRAFGLEDVLIAVEGRSSTAAEDDPDWQSDLAGAIPPF